MQGLTERVVKSPGAVYGVISAGKKQRTTNAELGALQALLRKLNPDAEQIVAERGRIDPQRILATGRFDFDRAASMPGWMAEMRGEESSEQDEFGIRSFVYRARRPLHPQRFHEFIQEEWPGVLRSKGFAWLATRHDFVGMWHQAGGSCALSGAGTWWATVGRDEWPEEHEVRAEIERNTVEPFGDRRQEIVVIGRDVDEAALCRRFDACLLTDAELGRVRGNLDSTRHLMHASMVDERLEPLRERLGLSKKELKKMVLSANGLLTHTHNNLLKKLDRLQGYLELADAELKKHHAGPPSNA